jgi:hypothetical protein
MDELAQDLYECLVARIYGQVDLTAEGGMTAQERAAIERFLDFTATEDDPEPFRGDF